MVTTTTRMKMTTMNRLGAYTSFAARARYRALKATGGVSESFRAWAKRTYANMPAVGKLAEIAGQGGRDAKGSKQRRK